MTTVFITLWRFPIYFEIHVATTARENVTSSGKDPVGHKPVNSFLVPLLLEEEFSQSDCTSLCGRFLKGKGKGILRFAFLSRLKLPFPSL